MSDREQIEVIKCQTLAVMAAVTAAPRPSYEIDGQSVMWAAYLEQLRRTVEWCDAKLAGDDPFEFQSQGSSR